jgi:hypothetical protein
METKKQKSENEAKITDYKCPMKCEGDKIYDKPGVCPVCNMKLVTVDGKKSQGNHCRCC